jgi:hypothetical protein
VTLSATPNEVIAKRIVARLRRRPPFGESWETFATRVISTALTMESTRRRREDFDRRCMGGVNAAAPD